MKHSKPVRKNKKILIIGAGPAGLGCAYEIAKAKDDNLLVDVVESDSQVGGLAKTLAFNGYLYDIGSHRFFTKLDVVNKLWSETLGDEFVPVKRLTRIYYNHKFFYYPLKPINAFFNLGILRTVRIIISLTKAKLLPYKKEDSFERWVINRFGRELYMTFFKSYTEKVWGIPCSEIRAKWAAQRIKNLSLVSVIINSLGLSKKDKVKSLIDQFNYPKFGAGYMYKKLVQSIISNNNNFGLSLATKVINLRLVKNKWQVELKSQRETRIVEYDHVVSSMPLTSLILQMKHNVPEKIKRIASKLKYRDFILVCMVLNQRNYLKDTWVYVHDPNVKIGRLQVLNNWGSYMLKDRNNSSYAAEYFCTEGDEIWTKKDDQLIELAFTELKNCKLIKRDCKLIQANVVRIKKAYPVYDKFYEDNISDVIEYLGTVPNLQAIGRYGMFKYNNMDHSIYTGMLAAKNILAGDIKFNIWNVNQDEEYQEEVKK